MLALIRENEIWAVPSTGGLRRELARDGASKLGLTWQDRDHLIFNNFDGRVYRSWLLSLGGEREEIFKGSEAVLAPV